MTNADIPSISNNINSFSGVEKSIEKAIPSPKGINLESINTANPEDFLPPIGKWTTIGGLVLLAAFGAGVTLTSILKYKTTVKVPATIRPAGELRLVQAATEGTVNSILVKGNQQVKQGDIIAVLDDSRLQTKKSHLAGNIQQSTIQLTQLTAQIVALDNQIRAEAEQTNRAVASGLAELQRTQREHQNRQISAISDVEEATANVRLMQEDLRRSKSELKSAQANLRSTAASLKTAKKKRDRYKSIVESGALSRDRYDEAILAVEQQQQALESQKAIVEAHKQTVAKQQRAIEVANARLKKVKTTLNPTPAEIAIARERIAQERARGEATSSRLKQQKEQLMQNQAQLQNQLQTYKKDLQQIETELEDINIRASASGIIAQLNLRNTSQVIRAGEMIAQIAPSDTPLEIKASIPSGEISKVELGQIVHMRVSACPYPDYGTLKGRVSSISPDAINPQSNSIASNSASPMGIVPQGASYQVQIKPDNLILNVAGKQCNIQLGMEGSADIISKEETVLTFMLRKARLLVNL